MRSPAPPAFSAKFTGPDGLYELAFEQVREWEGRLTTKIDGTELVWPVDVIKKEGDRIELSGLTYGSESIWDDVFWFQLIWEDGPKSIRYWGDRVVMREDPVA